MSNIHQSIQDRSASSGGGNDPKASGAEQQHAGNSGEGAASALAQLKTQTKQHRRQVGDGGEDPSEGPGQ
ncbi:MAG: hypothetical protein JWP65_781 [Ramlibacter sp.]|jgi:hypothetical protein|uniref:hypothetical protein n=1 Tax=Ramlibacter sp. TaxID=1917967 RepID=UPI0026283E69|nr:hypothetical protein [Ramlibacter sp.]MDB5750360.1 hypothetical protein [Ramlibacter sp.]